MSAHPAADTALDTPLYNATWRRRQVWTNLVGNALRFGSGREPAVLEIRGEPRGAKCSIM